MATIKYYGRPTLKRKFNSFVIPDPLIFVTFQGQPVVFQGQVCTWTGQPIT